MTIPSTLGFPGGSDIKESACNTGDPGLIPGAGRSPGEGKGYLLWYSSLQNSMDWRSPGGPEELDTTGQLTLTPISCYAVFAVFKELSHPSFHLNVITPLRCIAPILLFPILK